MEQSQSVSADYDNVSLHFYSLKYPIKTKGTLKMSTWTPLGWEPAKLIETVFQKNVFDVYLDF